VNIRTVDEAVVIGAALSLSSSAFVLQLLAEKGELPTRFGSATLGILLLQVKVLKMEGESRKIRV
jgi:Kef-type K+ transport system membrane component KefB